MSAETGQHLGFTSISELISCYSELQFVDDERIISQYKCARCNEIAISPFISSCGHIYCLDCKRTLNSRNMLITKCSIKECNQLIKKFDESSQYKEEVDNLSVKYVKCKSPKLLGQLLHPNGKRSVTSASSTNNYNESIAPQKPNIKMENSNNVMDASGMEPLLKNSDLNEWQVPVTEESTNYYNILLVGPTGVGKSTFINALANYLKYKHFDVANQSTLEIKISCQFTVWNYENKEQEVKYEADDNEMYRDGQSCTQYCKVYELSYQDVKLRFFDTPGMGDTRGIEMDKSNLDKTLKVLSKYQYLHGIVVLLKPNESRLTTTFNYCIKQLLSQLQKGASQNIIFVFTNSRGTFYRPGDTLKPVKAMLESIRNTPPYVDIPFKLNENIFCVDSEAFRFLLALKQEVKFNEHQITEFKFSWDTSRDACIQMLNYIVKGNNGKGLSPHAMQDTLNVNHARKIIIGLSKPLADIAQNIQDNVQVLNYQTVLIENCTGGLDEMRKHLQIPKITMKTTKLDKPCTVCTSANCAKLYKIEGNLVKYYYPQKCHNPCYLSKVPKNTSQNEMLRFCSAINPHNGVCSKCGCHYHYHMHIYYETHVMSESAEDPNIHIQIQGETDILKVKKNVKDNLTKEIRKYMAEEEILIKSFSKLVIFLQQNAIIPYNDAFIAYIRKLIENERVLSQLGSNNQLVIDGLIAMEKNFEKEIFALKNITQNVTTEVITSEEVMEIINGIFKLDLTGKSLKEAMDAQQLLKEKEPNKN